MSIQFKNYFEINFLRVYMLLKFYSYRIRRIRHYPLHICLLVIVYKDITDVKIVVNDPGTI